MQKWKIWTVIATVFISGVIIGSVGAGFYMRHRLGGILHQDSPAVKSMLIKKLTVELNLTAAQQEDAGKIVEETQSRLRELRMQYRPQMEAIINNGIADMKTKLSPEQQTKLDGLHEQMKMRWQRRRAG